MDMRIFAREVFVSDVENLSDFNERIRRIETAFRNEQNCKDKTVNFQFFYRGDRACMSTQSNLFRYKLLSKEKRLFEKWQKGCAAKAAGKCAGDYCGKVMCLAQMQHYEANTRLLDFSTDPFVALRFACGRVGENCRKKVTIYCTDQIDLTQSCPRNNEIEAAMMQLVTSDAPPADQDAILSQDIFIKVDRSFGRIDRQKGLFLFMGNHYHGDYNSKYIRNKKIAHELSSTEGRGKLYPGYVGVLHIAASAVEKIRNDLEEIEIYKMDYLMDKKREGEEK